MAEEEIKDETGAVLIKRIQKTIHSWMLMPTRTVLLAYNHEDEVPDKVQLRWLKFKTRPYIPCQQVLPMSRLRSCSTSLLQTDRRMSSLRWSTQVRRLSDEGPEEVRQLQRRPRFGIQGLRHVPRVEGHCPSCRRRKHVLPRCSHQHAKRRT